MKKGVVPVFIVLVAVLFIVGGGVFYYQRNKNIVEVGARKPASADEMKRRQDLAEMKNLIRQKLIAENIIRADAKLVWGNNFTVYFKANDDPVNGVTYRFYKWISIDPITRQVTIPRPSECVFKNITSEEKAVNAVLTKVSKPIWIGGVTVENIVDFCVWNVGQYMVRDDGSVEFVGFSFPH
jgi:hypothetical protein